MVRKPQFLLLLPLLISILSLNLLTSCSGKSAGGSNGNGLAMASMDSMPANVKSAPVTVQQAYAFAVANPDTLKQFPCYCGCGSMGHTSNYSCYVQSVDSQGKVTFDDHALGCSICVDITQDVMRLLKEKKSIQDIRAYVDTTYSKYGPSNMSGAVSPVSTGSAHSNSTPCADDGSQPCTLP